MRSPHVFVFVCLFFISCVDEIQSLPSTCSFGDIRECTDGPVLGECQRGSQFCWETLTPDNGWGVCKGEVRPTSEVCDDLDNDCDGVVDNGVTNACGYCGDVPEEICDGLDNDCDGEIDEGFENKDDLCDGEDNDCDGLIDEGLSKRRSCIPNGAVGQWIVFEGDENSFSSCQRGWQECRDGRWFGHTVECEDFVGPIPEVCDGVDNNCNGVVDDLDLVNACGISDIGACDYGREFCVESEIVCVGASTPQNEICDGVDNNCNGTTDEDLFRECETACGVGIEQCSEGSWIECTAVSPVEEICDNIDNDCDGEIDEDLDCNCNYGDTLPCLSNPCGWGLKTCLSNGIWSTCEGQIPQPELCNNHDDNCNEVIDEDLTLVCYDGEPDTRDVGICHAGESTCDSGRWGPCRSQQLPEAESCDGIDNDCDGGIDNLERFFEKVDLIFVIDVSGSMDDFIIPLREGLRNYVSALEGTEHLFGIVSFGQNENSGAGALTTPLTDINGFLDGLGRLVSEGAIEPSLDVIFDVSNPNSDLGIPWRPDATPIVVLITDEIAQTNLGLNPEDLHPFTHTCALLGCDNRTNSNWVTGDPLELFVFTHIRYFSPWTGIIAANGQRLFDIARMQETQTLEADLDLLFTEICIEE